jgi:hypothetical protein
MEVNFIDFNPNAAVKERYDYIADYISCDFDLGFEDAFYLIRQLKHNRSKVVIFGEAIADFHLYDDALHVQIDGFGFWFAENIDLEIAKEILKATFEGCEYFGQFITGTSKEWEAYTL